LPVEPIKRDKEAKEPIKMLRKRKALNKSVRNEEETLESSKRE